MSRRLATVLVDGSQFFVPTPAPAMAGEGVPGAGTTSTPAASPVAAGVDTPRA